MSFDQPDPYRVPLGDHGAIQGNAQLSGISPEPCSPGSLPGHCHSMLPAAGHLEPAHENRSQDRAGGHLLARCLVRFYHLHSIHFTRSHSRSCVVAEAVRIYYFTAFFEAGSKHFSDGVSEAFECECSPCALHDGIALGVD